jgi:hypothetical protein
MKEKGSFFIIDDGKGGIVAGLTDIAAGLTEAIGRTAVAPFHAIKEWHRKRYDGEQLIDIVGVLDKDGVLNSCRVRGLVEVSKKFRKGTPYYGHVMVLLQHTVDLLSGKKGITVRYENPEPGLLFLEVEHTAEGRDFLVSAGEFLVGGLKSVAETCRDNCRLSIRRT